ncbi:MAG: hypothetical protein NT116_00490 [Candidatus Parcubacteria bacterium]|nr:hypothetical protein [Candidatus Parcubacteria bacterium]
MEDEQKATEKTFRFYKVTWNYNETLAEMIEGGKYDYPNEQIFNNRNFPIHGAGKHEAELVLIHLDRTATTQEILDHLNSLGLESAKIEHLLAFGKTYPEIQLKSDIVALGSPLYNNGFGPYYPYLEGRRNNERILYVICGWLYSKWPKDYYFLAVPK